MIIFPAIDLYQKKAVRLLKGDYNQMTVYHDHPIEVAEDFVKHGATHIHMVDLEGARDGTTPNIEVVKQVADKTDLFIEIGGGIRNMETVKRYLNIGVERVILGTAALNDRIFLKEAAAYCGEKLAVGADIRDGMIAVKGWLEISEVSIDDFLRDMQTIGIKTVICTDISRDGAMRGTNLSLYQKLAEKYALQITASGGVTSIEDIIRLRELSLYGAIIGKAYYTRAINLKQAIEVAK